MEQPGGYGKVYHRTLHDPCKARAVVFDDGRRRVAVVGIDALITPRSVTLQARQEIERRTGIPAAAVMIAASHSHSSGPVGMVMPGEYDHASAFVQELAYQKSSGADSKYLDLLTRRIIEAVEKAWQNRRELRLGAGFGLEDRVAFNRRHRMKNGLTYTHPRYGNPEMGDYAGPIDPQVGVIGAWDERGELAGCVVNYACHATTSPGGISANWIYYLERMIRGGMAAPDATIVFLQGCSGDITQVDNKSPYAQPSGDDYAKLVGGRVGAEAVRTMLSMYPAREFGPVDHAMSTVKIARRKPDPARVAKCVDLVKQGPQKVEASEWTFAKEVVLLDALLAKWPDVEAEFQAIQVGPVAMLSNPGETFVEIGLEIKKRSPFLFTFPVELANGCVGYVPTEEALGPRGGGYETRLTSYTNLVPEAARVFVEQSTKVAQALTKSWTVTEPKKAPPFTAPWNYGAVGPEWK